ncbi:phage tail fiber C-terminal domain-containing protein [Escherichia coli]|uniref:phage tail fiber C-terminal domain-containing protein n=1 Tax=Escherichia coli TaxID=562 RepID=UPI000B3F6299|nr:phage tail fiber C-terminal domain-containing protein [Escherichia coli]
MGPAAILESDENGINPEQARVIAQVVILAADKKQIQCVVRPLQTLRADGTSENIGGMKYPDSFTKPESGSGFCCHVRGIFVR